MFPTIPFQQVQTKLKIQVDNSEEWITKTINRGGFRWVVGARCHHNRIQYFISSRKPNQQYAGEIFGGIRVTGPRDLHEDIPRVFFVDSSLGPATPRCLSWRNDYLIENGYAHDGYIALNLDFNGYYLSFEEDKQELPIKISSPTGAVYVSQSILCVQSDDMFRSINIENVRRYDVDCSYDDLLKLLFMVGTNGFAVFEYDAIKTPMDVAYDLPMNSLLAQHEAIYTG